MILIKNILKWLLGYCDPLTNIIILDNLTPNDRENFLLALKELEVRKECYEDILEKVKEIEKELDDIIKEIDIIYEMEDDQIE